MRAGQNLPGETMNDMEERLEKLEREIGRLRAREEICNLMAHYEVMHNQKNMRLHPMDFAMDTPDVSVQIADSDPCVGPDAVRRLFCSTYDDMDEEEYRGVMLVHYLTTPFLEVAGDGKTARGVWWSPGIETVKRTPGARAESVWCFGAYANDFILENGKWKIWHMRCVSHVKCPYAEGWADQRTFYVRKTGHSDHPSKLNNPYSQDFVQEALPMGPLPYEIWDDEEWYLRIEK